MRNSNVLKKLNNGEPVMCIANHYAVPDMVEMMGYMGIDVVWICNEHMELNPEKVNEFARAGRAADIDIMLRKTWTTHSDLIRPLEAGVNGLMVPFCKTAAMARDTVSHIKFPPLGKRGMDGANADARYGLVTREEYFQHANTENFLVMQIEDQDGVDNVEEIAACDGVDILYVGPGDLSNNLGVPGEPKHKLVQDAIKRTVAACERNGKYCATSGFDGEYTKMLLDCGVKFLAVGSDYGIFKTGIEQMINEFEANTKNTLAIS